MEPVLEPAPSVNSNPSPIPPPINSVPPFLSKTYDMVDDLSTNEVVSWSSGNNSFVVWDVPEFSKVFLPKYFKHNNFSSFVRQLNTYGFRKVDPDRWEFANEGFLRDQKQLLKGITRRKSSHVQQQNQQQTQVENSSLAPCVEVGKCGIAEEEVERLERDKNVLMQELVRLRHQQQATEHQLKDAVQKVQAMEQRQQQMMSFLAKVVQSPGFLNQLVAQQSSNDGDRQIQGSSNKKRRLPGEEANDVDRQIVKYQPSINEAAQTMLRQFLNMSSSNECESVSNSLNSSNTVSGVTLPEVSPDSAYSATNQVPEAGLAHHPQAGLVQPNLGPSPAAASWSPESECKTGNGECLDPIMAALGGSLEMEGDAVSPKGEGEMKELLVSQLPGVQDPFWEQFFADEAPVSGDAEETISGSVENNDLAMEQELSEWTRDQQQVNHITEQMGFLSSETHGGEAVKGI
ncbi:PREDICTED: heat stress transcription factor A-1b-like isoform X2 [Brassica oleracea var. oleracea]|uniref:heat stress transcription factor A-1b-like isoform X2 n=1 Tax=Brassica oleracea var. oleracea TaxID=109376 RepID=UPI0006A6CFAD|nr:PREDICTED: heat stress transcription factor A-1b-like isoform X2 [Brassica oleracea var. oleracea]XP_013613167.1 PREDICTED: heat stress transcription factor A-1b-like isoform X2 [Brassica oleracea var. oleracea]XP_013614421.1 PREDICTED: heat stress transcription factor A-1b-like isoform X2 [Brassica oleracea var. oleracea]